MWVHALSTAFIFLACVHDALGNRVVLHRLASKKNTIEPNGDICTAALNKALELQSAYSAANLHPSLRFPLESYPMTPETLRLITQSLKDGCQAWDVGASSRSLTSKFVVTHDGHWIVKVVAKTELASFDNILDEPWWYELTLPKKNDAKWNLDWHIWEKMWALGKQEGATYWTNQYCKSDELENPLCYTFEDPRNNYKRRVMSPDTGIVPIYFSIPEVSAIVMPNIVVEAKVMMNSVLSAQIHQFHKHDVKPYQVTHSAERKDFIRKLIMLEWQPKNDKTLTCNLCSGNTSCDARGCWNAFQKTLENDFRFLNDFRPARLVDYSLVFLLGAFHVGENIEERETFVRGAMPASCIFSRGKGIMLCTRVIDYLMERSVFRYIESVFKGGKYFKYKKAMAALVNCVGDLTKKPCQEYLQMACDNDFWSNWCQWYS